MARSLPEAMTLGLAGLCDVLRVDRLFGERLRTLVGAGPLTPGEWRRLRNSVKNGGSLADEEPAALRRSQASLAWQTLGWSWFVIGCVVVAVFVLVGNSSMRPGPVASFVFAVLTLVASISVGNFAVCLGIGRGWTLLGRVGRRNVVWLLVVASFWLPVTVPVLQDSLRAS